MAISVFKPSIRRKEMDAVLQCLVSDSIGPGEVAKELVTGLSKYLSTSGGVALREYPRAITSSLKALGLAPDTGVAISALSPGFYLDAIREAELTPYLVDVNSDTACIDADSLETLIRKNSGKEKGNIKVLLLHYPLGFVPDVHRILDTDLILIEDITQSLGANTGEKKVGAFGKYTILGLEADGIITAGGGAVVLCGNKRDQGELNKIAGGLAKGCYLSNMNAALGNVQTAIIEQLLESRKEIAGYFSRSLQKVRHRGLVQPGEAENVWYSFPVFLDGGMKEISDYAWKKTIRTIPAFQGSAVEKSGDDLSSFPNANNLLLRCILFPLYPTLGKKNVELISRVLSSLP
jgi:dTDP-4-amino-4,6-dideoxygalactose transaminase